MQISTVTQKGQITTPKNLRDKLGLAPYKKVELIEEKGSIDTPIGNRIQINKA